MCLFKWNVLSRRYDIDLRILAICVFSFSLIPSAKENNFINHKAFLWEWVRDPPNLSLAYNSGFLYGLTANKWISLSLEKQTSARRALVDVVYRASRFCCWQRRMVKFFGNPLIKYQHKFEKHWQRSSAILINLHLGWWWIFLSRSNFNKNDCQSTKCSVSNRWILTLSISYIYRNSPGIRLFRHSGCCCCCCSHCPGDSRPATVPPAPFPILHSVRRHRWTTASTTGPSWCCSLFRDYLDYYLHYCCRCPLTTTRSHHHSQPTSLRSDLSPPLLHYHYSINTNHVVSHCYHYLNYWHYY